VSQPVLQVVIASTRPGRVGGHVADWFVERARVHGGFEVEVVDLAEVDLPLLDEPNHPRLHHYTKQHTLRWSETISRGDAYVFVMPEYNYGINAALKNAIDYLFVEWQDKAVSFVSYGGVSGGLRAVQMLKQVISALKMVPTQDAVVLPFVRQYIDEAGGMSVRVPSRSRPRRCSTSSRGSRGRSARSARLDLPAAPGGR